MPFYLLFVVVPFSLNPVTQKLGEILDRSFSLGACFFEVGSLVARAVSTQKFHLTHCYKTNLQSQLNLPRRAIYSFT